MLSDFTLCRTLFHTSIIPMSLDCSLLYGLFNGSMFIVHVEWDYYDTILIRYCLIFSFY